MIFLFCTPEASFAAKSVRVVGERGYFSSVAQSSDILGEFGTGPSTLKNENPANVAFISNSEKGSVYFSLRGLKGWDIPNTYQGASGICNSSSDLECQKIIRNRNYTANLTPCFSEQQTDCVSRLSVKTSDGKVEDALPIRELPPTSRDYSTNDLTPWKPFAADAATNMPAGGHKWLWVFPSYRNSSGRLFLPLVTLSQSVNVASADEAYRFADPSVWISLNPVAAEPIETNSPFTAATASTFNLRRETFKKPDMFSIEFRTSTPWTTWNKASLTDLSISFQKSKSDYIYTVSGRASQIPEVGKNIKITKDNYSKLKEVTGANFHCPDPEGDLSLCDGVIYVGGKGGVFDETFNALERVEKFIDSKSEGLTYFWLVQTTIETPLSAKVQNCTATASRQQPAGTTTSNATLLQDGPPTWNEKDSTFEYRVGALSRLPDGSKFEGTYTVQLSTELAQCLWGKFPTSPTLAVQVLNSDQSVQVITSKATATGKTFIFNISGFHFSSPRIVVSMKQSVPSNKVVTIVCVHGATSKKVSGSSPICPKGYAKK